MTPDLSILIVNWNSVTLLRSCLHSIAHHPSSFTTEVVVVDNASFDGSAEMLAREFPDARFVQNSSNAGFARANNVAFRASRGRILLFLNPDTEVHARAIERLARFVDANAGAGAVGCRLLNSDGTVQTSCIQAFPTVINQLLDSELLRRIAPRSSLWGMAALYQDTQEPMAIEAVSGACLVTSRKSFELVGGFTTDYFMYAEDLDLCYKLRKAGKTNYYVGDVDVTHHGGQSTAASAESQFGNVMLRESVWRFLKRHRGSAYALSYQVTTALAALLRLAAIMLALLLTFGHFRARRLRAMQRKWLHVLRWALGGETWATRMGTEVT